MLLVLFFFKFQIGTVAGNLLSGLLLHYYSWPSVFYVFGGVAIVWFLVFVSKQKIITFCKKRKRITTISCFHLYHCLSQTVICYSDPGSHPFISKEEREYLQTELGQLKRNDNLPTTPWISILTSVPMIALVCAQVRKKRLQKSAI